jgi:hypothetical protein
MVFLKVLFKFVLAGEWTWDLLISFILSFLYLSHRGYPILEGLANGRCWYMLWQFVIFGSKLIFFPFLVCFSKKNLATLRTTTIWTWREPETPKDIQKQVCQIFFTIYQNGEIITYNIPNNYKIKQMTTKHIKSIPKYYGTSPSKQNRPSDVFTYIPCIQLPSKDFAGCRPIHTKRNFQVAQCRTTASDTVRIDPNLVGHCRTTWCNTKIVYQHAGSGSGLYYIAQKARSPDPKPAHQARPGPQKPEPAV